ncbi:MAG: MEDS domain-containing protein, partial [Proteobacteria bacterium]|nr:MEDS domain-containing protein [Pseudomonadota bacterium]
MRKSGIDIVGNIPWGTHLCQFYETARDLTDVLVPYFKAGLKNNEFCLWVTSSPLSKAEAEKALKKAIPGFDRYVKKGQIEIVPHTQWYLKDNGFKLKRVLKGWVDKLDQALARGYDGMRVEGNLAWLGRKDWKNFIEYEEEINKIIGNLRMIAVCSYNLGKCSASDVIEVVNNHHFALIRRDGKWNVLENVHHRFTRQVMKATKEQLALVVEADLDAIIAIDEAGNISLFNPAAEELFQYGLDEVLFQPVRVLLREDVSEVHHKRLERFLTKGIGRCGHIGRRTEFTFRRKDGTPFDGELSMSGARVGGKRMIVVSIRDITER